MYRVQSYVWRGNIGWVNSWKVVVKNLFVNIVSLLSRLRAAYRGLRGFCVS